MTPLPPEGLQDLLLDLRRARQDAAEERRLRNALLQGLSLVSSPRSAEAMTEEMLAILQSTLDFEAAFLLIPDESGSLTTWASTLPQFEQATWEIGPLFSRVQPGVF